MGKMIAIWGPPGVGKTTLAVKLGAALHDTAKMSVYTVFADTTTPALPVLFPTRKADELFSLGSCLSKADITQREIENSTVTVKKLADAGYLGYKDGENRYSYAAADDTKCIEFLTILRGMADIVIVDCTSIPDTLSKAAMTFADTVIRVVAPDLKSVCFCSSQLPIMAGPDYQCDDHLIVVSVNTNDVIMPVDDIAHAFSDTPFILPYCAEVRQQSFNGNLMDRVVNNKFNAKLNVILNKVLE